MTKILFVTQICSDPKKKMAALSVVVTGERLCASHTWCVRETLRGSAADDAFQNVRSDVRRTIYFVVL